MYTFIETGIRHKAHNRALQASKMLQQSYVSSTEPVPGAIGLPTEAELQPLLHQLAQVEGLKQKGNECVVPPLLRPDWDLDHRGSRRNGFVRVAAVKPVHKLLNALLKEIDRMLSAWAWIQLQDVGCTLQHA